MPDAPKSVGFILRVGSQLAQGFIPEADLALSPAKFIDKHLKPAVAKVLGKQGKR